MRIGDLMDRDLTSVAENTPLKEAIEMLSQHNLTGLPVVDEMGFLVGFISEKDIIKASLPSYCEYLEKGAAFIPDFDQLSEKLRKKGMEPVGKYMTRKVIYFSEDDSDLHAALSLIQQGLKMAPVVREDGVFVGIVSRAHLIEHIMCDEDE